METVLANPLAVRSAKCTSSTVHHQTKFPKCAPADVFLCHCPSSRPICRRRLQNPSPKLISSPKLILTPECSAASQRPSLKNSSRAAKRGGFCSKALARGGQPAQGAKSQPGKAFASHSEQDVADSMSESQFWRLQIDRSLGEMASPSGGMEENELGLEQSGGKAEEASRAHESSHFASYSSDPSFTPAPSLQQLGDSGSLAEASPHDDAQAKPLPNEASMPSPKTLFMRRETGLNPDRLGRPQIVATFSAEGWGEMPNLLGAPAKQLERNSSGSGPTSDSAAGERGAEAGVQQEEKLPRGPATAPPGGRRPPVQERRRPAPVAVLPRESVASAPSTNMDKVDRSELTKLRQSLNKKLSDANMYNRHLQREIAARDAAVDESMLFLGALQTELETLVEIAKEIAAGGTTPVTRKINGRYVQSHLALRLEDLHSQLDGQLQQVDLVRLRDVPVTWLGVAEDVKLMGSFDGWTQGHHLSPETTGSYTLFSSVLQLRPGRYEVKFVVDGNWQLAPSWPVVGEGLSANNLLVVE